MAFRRLFLQLLRQDKGYSSRWRTVWRILAITPIVFVFGYLLYFLIWINWLRWKTEPVDFDRIADSGHPILLVLTGPVGIPPHIILDRNFPHDENYGYLFALVAVAVVQWALVAYFGDGFLQQSSKHAQSIFWTMTCLLGVILFLSSWFHLLIFVGRHS
jgi:magnesium-transporting ATPase (P-type)